MADETVPQRESCVGRGTKSRHGLISASLRIKSLRSCDFWTSFWLILFHTTRGSPEGGAPEWDRWCNKGVDWQRSAWEAEARLNEPMGRLFTQEEHKTTCFKANFVGSTSKFALTHKELWYFWFIEVLHLAFYATCLKEQTRLKPKIHKEMKIVIQNLERISSSETTRNVPTGFIIPCPSCNATWPGVYPVSSRRSPRATAPRWILIINSLWRLLAPRVSWMRHSVTNRIWTALHFIFGASENVTTGTTSSQPVRFFLDHKSFPREDT